MSSPDPVPRKILIVRPSALGDVSRTVPALVTLRRAHPEARIDWLVQDAFADVVRHHPGLDQVVPFDRKRYGRLWRSPGVAREAWAWARNLRGQRYDMVVDLQGLLRSGLLTWLTGARLRIGYANAAEGAALAYNRRYRVDRSLHAVDRMLALLEAHGYEPVRDMRLHVGADDAEWFEALRHEHGLSQLPYAVLAPTARWPCKCWPIENFIEISRRLLALPNVADRLLVLAGPGERDQVAPLLDALGERAICPPTTVGQLMAIVSEARLLASNDSAPLHIAVGFDRPIVAVYGPTDPALVGPYRRMETVVRPPGIESMGPINYRRHRDDPSLISKVTVDVVWEKVAEQLGDG